jgi:hypothetical protein
MLDTNARAVGCQLFQFDKAASVRIDLGGTTR